MSEKLDYLIVGQGVAGTCLGIHLLNAHKKFKIINRTSSKTSSQIAAGILNPITGKNMVKTWNADLLFQYLGRFYKDVESLTRSKFFFDKIIYRPFHSVEQQNEWQGRSTLNSYKIFLNNTHYTPQFRNVISNEFGGISIKYGGYVNATHFINKCKELFIRNESYIEGSLDYKKIDSVEEGIRYENLQTKRLILCEGIQMTDLDIFDTYPLKPVKGEILQIDTSNPIEQIFIKGVFILPLENKTSWVGSTYDYDDYSVEITKKAREKLIEKTDRLLKIPYEITDQFAGIRPATTDRRPILGLHPKNNRIGIFNGLGSKGFSLAPYLSKQFFEFLETGKELDSELNLSRFF